MTTDPKEKADNDNHSNQLNPNNTEYENSRTEPSSLDDDDDDTYDSSDDDWADDDYMSDFD